MGRDTYCQSETDASYRETAWDNHNAKEAAWEKITAAMKELEEKIDGTIDWSYLECMRENFDEAISLRFMEFIR